MNRACVRTDSSGNVVRENESIPTNGQGSKQTQSFMQLFISCFMKFRAIVITLCDDWEKFDARARVKKDLK